MANEGLDLVIDINTDVIIKDLEEKAEKALTECGLMARDYAAELSEPADTGRLRASMDYRILGDTVYIGTNVEYAVYVEYGTGKYASNGNGRPNPWYYEDENGEGHWTSGMKPRHMLKKAVENHADEYREVVKNTLKNE